MKQIKLFSMVLLLATMFIGFTACSDDDDDNPNKGNEGKKITTIVNEFEGEIRTEKFTYTNGKLSKYVAKYTNRDENDKDDEANLQITYNGNTVTMTGEYDNYKTEFVYSLTNGLATSCKMTDEYSDSENYTFDYSKDGYLIGMSEIYSDGANSTFTFTNINGNLAEITDKYSGSFNSIESYKYTYSNDKNIGSIMNPFMRGNLVLYYHVPAYYAGILGKGTANLATKEIYISGADKEELVCTYSIENDGYVKSAIVSDGNKFTYTFE